MFDALLLFGFAGVVCGGLLMYAIIKNS